MRHWVPRRIRWENVCQRFALVPGTQEVSNIFPFLFFIWLAHIIPSAAWDSVSPSECKEPELDDSEGSFWCSKILGLLSNLCCLWYMSTLQLSGLLSHSSLRGGIARDEQTSPGGWNHWTLTIIQLLQFEHTLCLAPLKASYANKAFSSSHPLTEVGTSIIIPNVQVRKLRLINPPWAPIQES